MKKIWDHIFVDGLSGMAFGLFSTLIIGTILQQIGGLIGGVAGSFFLLIGKIAAAATSAGIGVGVAYKFKENSLVVISAATAGMVGGYASQILAAVFGGTVGEFVTKGPGEPLGAFVAALVGIEVGRLVAGKTSMDILLTPLVTIGAGSVAGLLLGPPISGFMGWLGSIINWGVEQQPFLMSIVVSVLMGMILTLPISSAALGIALNLSGMAAGAATVGCCCNMIGFAVSSYRENGIGGFFAQGVGTSMLQVPNIIRRPWIWIPEILASAILAPVGVMVFRMMNNSIGSGMGTSGLVGSFMTWQTMAGTESGIVIFGKILLIQFVLPGIVAFSISEFMRKLRWIRSGDMKLDKA